MSRTYTSQATQTSAAALIHEAMSETRNTPTNLVNVKINNQHSRGQLFVDDVTRSYCHVIEQTESGSMIWKGMVSTSTSAAGQTVLQRQCWAQYGGSYQFQTIQFLYAHHVLLYEQAKILKILKMTRATIYYIYLVLDYLLLIGIVSVSLRPI